MLERLHVPDTSIMQHTIQAALTDNTVTVLTCTRGRASALRMARKLLARDNVLDLTVTHCRGTIIYSYIDEDAGQ